MKNLTTAIVNALPYTWLVIDDTIECLRELTDNTGYTSIFDSPTLAFYKRLNDEFGAVVLLPLFHTQGYNVDTKTNSWNLTQMTDRFKAEFTANASWLKMGPHSWASNVRYREGSTGVSGGIDYDRNAYADFMVIKAEVLRFAGAPVWYSHCVIPHFYDIRKSEAQQLYTEEGTRMLCGFGAQQWNRTESSYLDAADIALMVKYGFVQDRSVYMIHCLRDFAFERIRGTLKVAGTPDTVIEYLDSYLHPSMTFMNPETHEVQVAQDKGLSTINTYSNRHDILDFCSWCKSRGYGWRFPYAADFKLIQF